MSGAAEMLATLGLSIAREAYEYGKKRLRKVAADAGLVVSEQQLEVVLGAQLMLMHAAQADMYSSIVRLRDISDKAERDFRNSPNVTVVDSLDEPFTDEKPTE